MQVHVNTEAASSAFSGSPKENTYSCEQRKVRRVEYLSQGLSSKVRWELGEKSKSFQHKSVSISLNFSYCYSLSYSSIYPSSDQIFSRFIFESSAEMNKTWSPRPLLRIKWEANPNHPINTSLSPWDAVQLPTSQLTTKWVITSVFTDFPCSSISVCVLSLHSPLFWFSHTRIQRHAQSVHRQINALTFKDESRHIHLVIDTALR